MLAYRADHRLWGLRGWAECAAVLLGERAARLGERALSALYSRRSEAEADFLGYYIAKVAGFHVEGNRHRLDYDTWLWEKHGASRSWWQRLTASYPPSRRRAQALAVFSADSFAPRAPCTAEARYPLTIMGDETWRVGQLHLNPAPLWAVRVVNYAGSGCSRLNFGKVLGRGEHD